MKIDMKEKRDEPRTVLYPSVPRLRYLESRMLEEGSGIPHPFDILSLEHFCRAGHIYG